MTVSAWGPAVELARYQDEPKQMRSAIVGKSGYLRMGFERRGAATALIDLERRTPLFVHKAMYWDEALPTMPCVFLITTTGGILQGDRLHMVVNLAPNTQAHLTTQSATQIHSMDANYAEQTQEFNVSEGGYLEYLPDPICPHSHSRFLTRTRITVDESATVLYAETLMPGRKYHKGGEVFAFDLYSSTVQVQRPSGEQLVTEKYVIEPEEQNLRQFGYMNGFDVFGNVMLLTPKRHADAIFAQVPATFDRANAIAAGASRLPNDAGLIYKVLGRETQPVEAKIREFWALVRSTVLGVSLMPKFLWR